jgi:hypothetical protein
MGPEYVDERAMSLSASQQATTAARAGQAELQSKAGRPADKAIFTYSKREDRPAERGTVPL